MSMDGRYIARSQDGGANMYSKYGISRRTRDGGANMPMDGRQTT